jgi:hypothetical protein
LYPALGGLDDDSLALMFASITAYQTARYGVDDPGIDRKSLSALLNARHLECATYTTLMQLLYFNVLKTPSSAWTLYWVGWNAYAPFGNHDQVIAFGPHRTTLLLDPTINLVAKVKLAGGAIPTGAYDIYLYNTRSAPTLSTFTQSVVSAMENSYHFNYLSSYILSEALAMFGGNYNSRVGINGGVFEIISATNPVSGGRWSPVMGPIRSFGVPHGAFDIHGHSFLFVNGIGVYH